MHLRHNMLFYGVSVNNNYDITRHNLWKCSILLVMLVKLLTDKRRSGSIRTVKQFEKYSTKQLKETNHSAGTIETGAQKCGVVSAVR